MDRGTAVASIPAFKERTPAGTPTEPGLPAINPRRNVPSEAAAVRVLAVVDIDLF